MKDVAVVSYCRTAIARALRGALNLTHGIPMAAHVLVNAVQRAGIEPGEIEDVVVGCGLPEGATEHNIARNAALELGVESKSKSRRWVPLAAASTKGSHAFEARAPKLRSTSGSSKPKR